MVDRVFHEVLEWIYAIVIALAIAIVVHTFLIQPTRVSGESMVPTLHNGEYLLISKISHDLMRFRIMATSSSLIAVLNILVHGKTIFLSLL